MWNIQAWNPPKTAFKLYDIPYNSVTHGTKISANVSTLIWGVISQNCLTAAAYICDWHEKETTIIKDSLWRS